MSLQVIPLTSTPNQEFSVQLDVDGHPLTLGVTFTYDEMASYWIMSISNASNQLLVSSVPVLVGSYPAANLLEQHKYLGIGSWYIINISNLVNTQPSTVGYGSGDYGGGDYGGYGGDMGASGTDWPNQNNLGKDFQLWVDDTPTV